MGVPHAVVWEALADLGSHAAWMRDAESVVFVTDQTSGAGTVMHVETVIGPFRTLDVMEIMGWDEGHSIEVAHRGVVRGRGSLSATPRDTNTVVAWDESLVFPWWLGGPLTAWLARPILTRMWCGNLRRLEETLSCP